MPRGPSKASKPWSKPSKPGKSRSKPSKPGEAQSEPSWGWQPDGRYIPLTDDGKLPAHLPDHIELHLRNELEDWKRRYFELGRHVERLRAKLIELKFDPDTV
jgi:hypothetical protein